MSQTAIQEKPPIGGLRPFVIWAAIIATGALGILLKTPFGQFMMHLMGMPASRSQDLWQLLFASEWGWLTLGAIGTLIFYQRAGFRPAPILERLLFADTRTGEKPRLFMPALLGGLVCMLFFAAHQMLGFRAPLISQMASGHIAHADQVKLMMLYPLADIGAALSEEPIYRFGLMTTLMGIFSFVRRGGGNPNTDVNFWIANIVQAAFFGFIHVQQGAVTSQAGGIFLQTLISPPTWSGFTLAYVYRRWGIESAILGHIAADIFVPVLFILMGMVHF
jgi:hypothetical protein